MMHPKVARSGVDFVFEFSAHDKALQLKLATQKWECRFLLISPIWPKEFGVCALAGERVARYAAGSKWVFSRGP